jgi:hypothetical protein
MRSPLEGTTVTKVLAVVLLALGLLDTTATVVWFYVAEWWVEGNPLMAFLLEWGVSLFVASKVMITLSVCGLLYEQAHRPIALLGTLICVPVYTFILYRHAQVFLMVIN